MRANCPSCNTAYQVDDAKIPPTGAKLKCSKCSTLFPIGGKAAASAAVPLPGSVGPAAVPLPGQVRSATGAVPLPGSVGPGPGEAAVALPGTAGQSDRTMAVPLPGGAPGAAVPLPSGPGAFTGAAVPLPASPRNELAAADPNDAFDPPPQAGVDSLTESEVDLAGGEADPFALDLSQPPPPPAPRPATAAAPAPAPAEDVDPFAMDFGEPAAPAAAPPADDVDPFAMDFGEPAAPAPSRPPTAVPQASRPPTAGPAADPFGGDNLEFDPTAPSKPQAADDLEADLSAPIAGSAPAPQPQGDDLELLDFIDDAEQAAKAKSKGRPSRKATFDGFQVRNRAGKIFGPMPESEVVKLLAEGKLLGNEEITRDGESWQPFGSHGPFGEALQKLMEAPGGLPGASSDGNAPDLAGEAAPDVNERIKQIYGGRMAGIVIVDSAESVRKIKKRLPLIIGGAVLGLLVAFGAYLGFTPYGFFGYRHFFPPVIKPGSALYKNITAGREDLAKSTHGSLESAIAQADTVLRANDQFIDARSLYALAAFTLKAQYGEASGDAIARAHKYVEEMKVAQPTNPDVVAAAGAEALVLGNAAEQRPLLEKALAALIKTRPQGAAQVALELASSYAKAHDAVHAKQYFTQAEGLGESHAHALALHAEYLVSVEHDAPAAGKLLAQAAKEAPDNGPVVLQLAGLRVGVLADPEHVESLLAPILEDAKAKQLSTEEQARAHALLGMVRVYEKKLADAEVEFKKATALAPKSAAVEAAYAGYLLKRGLFDQAQPLFQDAYNQHPDDLEVLDGLVVSLVGNDQPANAEKLVADGAARFPKSARIAVLRGLVAQGEDKVLEAEAEFKKAIELDPKYTRADLHLGQVYLKTDKLKEAHHILEAALKKAPDDPELNTAWGELAMAENRVDDAQKIFEQAIKLDNDSAPAHLGRARALLAKSQLADAQGEAELAIKQDERLPGNHTTLGDVFFAQGDFDKARGEFQAAIKQDSKDDSAYLMLGRSLFSMGNFDEAQVAFENAHTLSKSSYHPFFWLALTHLKKHEITQAIEAMNDALDNGGQADPDVHYNFGLIYKAGDGHYNDALDEFKTALKLRPKYVEVLDALGDALADASDFKAAQTYYEQAFSTDGTKAALLGKIATALYKQGQLPKAIDAWKRHIAADPTAVGDYYQIGQAYTDLNRKKDAVAAFKTATVKDPKNAKPFRALGFAYKESNRNRDAIAAFRKYLELSPKADDAKDIQLEIDGLTGN